PGRCATPGAGRLLRGQHLQPSRGEPAACFPIRSGFRSPAKLSDFLHFPACGNAHYWKDFPFTLRENQSGLRERGDVQQSTTADLVRTAGTYPPFAAITP
ncbi:hypothetical protein, partial [Streptomyces sp. 1222.5]|uniref:hypothetical protein n=1 Tax=Streptomyces sp. 1222.5 TaxID=1881026 RepID=UPI003D72A966